VEEEHALVPALVLGRHSELPQDDVREQVPLVLQPGWPPQPQPNQLDAPSPFSV